MKQLLLSALIALFTLPAFAQVEEAELLFHWEDNSLPENGWLHSRYNEVWGFVQNNREYAVIGSTNGTHIFDVTDTENAYEAAYIPGKYQGSGIVHRDFHDYNGYLYAVSDEGASSLQIIDISQLPDAAPVVYDSDELIVRAHNIFIDSAEAKLYALGVTTPLALFSVCVYSLDDPVNPIPLGCYPNASVSIPYAHDAFIRNDTAWLNCGGYGLYMVDFSTAGAPVILGTMDGYPQEGYNHSGWMHETLPYYYMADETLGSDLKVVDVSDPQDMQVVNTFDSEPADGGLVIPHNLIVRGHYLYVSYYYEGLQVYDISEPVNPQRVLYYDTYPDDVNVNQLFFQGAWGVYPFLPSGHILVSDLNNGLFVTSGVESPVSAPLTFLPDLTEPVIKAGPNPVQGEFSVYLRNKQGNQGVALNLLNMQGQLIQPFGKFELNTNGEHYGFLQLSPNVPAGIYLLQAVFDNGEVHAEKLIVGE